jgi:RNA polymerase sigma-32 factor
MSTSSIVVKDPWSMVPSLGDLNAYIRAVGKIPLLTHEEELDYSNRLRNNNDLEAAGRLVLSHLRLVVSIARQYINFGFQHADLIQEGNVGLMKAVKNFDPSQGARLATYATYWIKSEIHEFILRNWRMVKIATTKAQRKLFFNLKTLKGKLRGDSEETYRSSLSEAEIEEIAEKLNVKPAEVAEMEARLAGNDVVLDPVETDSDDERAYAPIDYLADESSQPEVMIEASHREQLAVTGIHEALENLDDRSRRIIKARWLEVSDEGKGGKTLHELAAELGVSAERVRQIEAAALKKMRKHLTNVI